jgi:hypothetical protein
MFAQTESATVGGSVSDTTGALLTQAKVRLIDIDRGTQAETESNTSGFYTFAGVHPGRYRMEVEKSGFKVVHLVGVIVNVQDNLEENFRLDVGACGSPKRCTLHIKRFLSPWHKLFGVELQADSSVRRKMVADKGCALDLRIKEYGTRIIALAVYAATAPP